MHKVSHFLIIVTSRNSLLTCEHIPYYNFVELALVPHGEALTVFEHNSIAPKR